MLTHANLNNRNMKRIYHKNTARDKKRKIIHEFTNSKLIYMVEEDRTPAASLL